MRWDNTKEIEFARYILGIKSMPRLCLNCSFLKARDHFYSGSYEVAEGSWRCRARQFNWLLDHTPNLVIQVSTKMRVCHHVLVLSSHSPPLTLQCVYIGLCVCWYVFQCTCIWKGRLANYNKYPADHVRDLGRDFLRLSDSHKIIKRLRHLLFLLTVWWQFLNTISQ